MKYATYCLWGGAFVIVIFAYWLAETVGVALMLFVALPLLSVFAVPLAYFIFWRD
jgi:hypothetical protein